MPISIDPASQGDFLYVHFSEKLTDEDYKNVFLPALKEKIQKFGHVNALIEANENFNGWTLHAMWDDAKFGWLHRKDFKRIAFVGEMKMVDYSMKIANHLMDAELKSYKPQQLSEAKAFVQG